MKCKICDSNLENILEDNLSPIRIVCTKCPIFQYNNDYYFAYSYEIMLRDSQHIDIELCILFPYLITINYCLNRTFITHLEIVNENIIMHDDTFEIKKILDFNYKDSNIVNKITTWINFQ